MNEPDEILVIVFSIIGVFSFLFIMIFSTWCIIRERSKKKHLRQKYERSKNVSTASVVLNKRKQRKKRFNTNESGISSTFNSPHLINQNVKNLDQFVVNESSTPRSNHLHADFKSEVLSSRTSTTPPVYTSSSSPFSGLVLGLQSYPQNQHLNSLHFKFLNELNHHILYLKQHEKSSNPLRYSQSCRQPTDCLPFDYSRSMTPLSTYKTRFAQFQDDTAIFY